MKERLVHRHSVHWQLMQPNGALPIGQNAKGFFPRYMTLLKINTLVVHPVTYALAVSNDVASVAEGPFVGKPLITTGAGDHFNSGFCLGKMLGLDNAMSVLTGVTTSGFYVRTAKSPTIAQLAEMMQNWQPRGES